MCKVGKLFVLMMSTTFLSFAPAVVWAGELPGEPQAFGQSVSDSALDLVEDDGRDHGSILIETNPLTRASGTYESTYNMDGGVYTRQNWTTTAAPTFKVTIEPTSFEGSDSKVGMGIYLEKKELFGWSAVDEGRVTLMAGGTVTLKGSAAGTYRIYLRNWSGLWATGKVKIRFSY